jgi:uridine phosphorylase
MRSSVGIFPASLAIRSVAVPARLRPTAPIAPEAILVGDPGRALLLAQELLEQPKMSNHARGLWGYSGSTPEGRALTIQSTGIGGPSATLVLADLAELGVRLAIRVGTCVALDRSLALGQLLVVDEAIAVGGSAAAFGAAPGASLTPDERLTASLWNTLGEDARRVAVASFDDHPPSSGPEKAVAADMQSAPLLARARGLGVGVAALLMVAESAAGDQLAQDELEGLEKTAGRAAARALLSP